MESWLVEEKGEEEKGEEGDDHGGDGSSSLTLSYDSGPRAKGGQEPFPSYDTTSATPKDNFKVVVRVRPPLPREVEPGGVYHSIASVAGCCQIALSGCLAMDLVGERRTHTFAFDQVYDQDCEQLPVYDTTAKHAVASVIQGYNATVIAYGQTSAGKTYTMEGIHNSDRRGIIPRATEDLFRYIESCTDPRTTFLVRTSFLQIYNEAISDLLKPDRLNLAIREDRRRGVFVEGLSEWVVRSASEINDIMQRGSAARATSTTRLNDTSSRSHAVFIVIVEQSHTSSAEEGGNGAETTQRKTNFRVGKLNFVDLAGSERIRVSGSTGQRLEEAKKINQSLAALGNVIAALTDKRKTHIPYRDSKLTRLLEDSLGGNCITTFMAMISPAPCSFAESLSTLKFANRAKRVCNVAHVNEDVDQKTLLRRYELELQRLRKELDERNRNVVGKRKLLELEDKRRQAEEDRVAAITQLERMSQELLLEKAEKRKLEEQIRNLTSQLLRGGDRHTLSQQYERRLLELEAEREIVERDMAQVDRYKQLLLKQRDIMMALTERLRERDDALRTQRHESEVLMMRLRETEDALDERTAGLLHLERSFVERDNTGICPPPPLDSSFSHDEKLYTPFTGDTVLVEPPKELHSIVNTFSSSFFHIPVDFSSPYEGQLLTADEKVVELSQLVEKLAAGLETMEAEKSSLESLLHEKLERMVQAEVEGRLRRYRLEVQRWRANNTLAEIKARTSDWVLQLSRFNSNTPEFHEELATLIQRERELVEGEFRVNDEERQRAMTVAEELREEVDSLRRVNKQLELELATVREEDQAGLQPPSPNRSPSPVSRRSRPPSRPSSALATSPEGEKNAHRGTHRRQTGQDMALHGHDRHVSVHGEREWEEKERELALLRERQAVMTRERQALQTVMQKKIAPRLQFLMEALDEYRVSSPQMDHVVKEEADALGRLVHAIAVALRDEEQETNTLCV